MRVLLCLLVVLSFVNLSAQTVLNQEDFEHFEAGYFGNQSNADNWVTWDNSYEGTSDAIVVDTNIARSGSKVLWIDEQNDIIYQLKDKTSGRYEVKFYLYISELKAAYFNLMQNLEGDAKWGMQVHFQPHGIAVLDADGDNVDTINFDQQRWLEIQMFVDLDDDYATLYFDSTEVRSWTWSKGSQGYNNDFKLDAINFYGMYGNNGSSGFYIDDLSIIEHDAFDGVEGIEANLNGSDVTLNWEAIEGLEYSTYSVMRNQKQIVKSLIDTIYVDEHLYPTSYDYVVRVEKEGFGYSRAMDTASFEIEAGKEREVVLMELVTGTWCYYCPGASRAVEQMTRENKDIAIIEYHGGDDDFTNEFSEQRIAYYGANYFPTAIVDGGSQIGSGSYSGTMYDAYEPVYSLRKEVSSMYDIGLYMTKVDDTSFSLRARVQNLYDYYKDHDFKFHIAVTESEIEHSWQNMDSIHFALREMIPSASGTLMEFDESGEWLKEFEFNISNEEYNLDHTEFIFFLQSTSTKEVMQAKKIAYKHIYNTSVEELDMSLDFYPNPASDKVFVKGKGIQQVNFYNMNGQLILSQELNGSNQSELNVLGLESGLYFIEVNADKQSYTFKFLHH